MKLNNGYHIEAGVIYHGDKTIGAIDMPELEGFMAAARHSDTLLDMFAMVALPAVVKARYPESEWPRKVWEVADAILQERAKRVAPKSGGDGGGL